MTSHSIERRSYLPSAQGLQLLEFLIKNGSERVIDDARSHLSLLKMLRQFHYIDQNGKDQGVNVRNRAKELAELLSDVDRIRAERKKARANRNKFGGVEGGMGMGGGMSSGSRYGGFGSEDAGGYGGYSGGVYGDGGGFGGTTGGFQDSGSRRDRFEEYDEEEEGAGTASARRKPDHSSTPSSSRKKVEKIEKPKPKEPEVDLFSFGDDEIASAPALAAPPNGNRSSGNGMDDQFSALQTSGADEDDFDDFQSANPTTQISSQPSVQGLPPPTATSTTTSSTQFAAPRPVSGVQGANLTDLVGFSSISPAPGYNTATTNVPSRSTVVPQPQPQPQQQQPLRPSGYQASQPNYFTSIQVPSAQSQTQQTSKPSLTSTNSHSHTQTRSSTAKPSSSSADAFGSLWSTASAGAGIKKTGTPTNQGPNLASMAKEKASAGIWGTSTVQTQNQRPVGQVQGQSSAGAGVGGQQKPGGGLDDLLG